jgi:anhydro-N-acetylmuramic acid kinase
MIYKAIGIMSSGNPASITLSFTAFTVIGKQWQYEIIATENILYPEQWQRQLLNAKDLSVENYMQLHQQLGAFIGEVINNFIEQHGLQHQVQLIACNGHTIIDLPSKNLSVQMGEGASIAATTGLSVISDLSAINIALGGKAANMFSKAAMLLHASPDNITEDPLTQMPAQFKESVLTALLGVLRWREEATILPTENETTKVSIGGALWIGSDA